MTISEQTTYAVQIEDVEYLHHGDKPFLARLFRPLGSGPFPVMVEAHGGAWVNGSREDGDAGNEALAGNGVIVAALDFRVPPEASYPASLADIHYGIRWCKSHAQDWNGTSGVRSASWVLPVALTRLCCLVCGPTTPVTRRCIPGTARLT